MLPFQFSGQGAMTFYTALIFREAKLPSALAPNDASVVIGLTYLISSIVGLVLKRHFGRRPLLLASGMLNGLITLLKPQKLLSKPSNLYQPLVGKTLFSSVPPSNSLVSVLDP